MSSFFDPDIYHGNFVDERPLPDNESFQELIVQKPQVAPEICSFCTQTQQHTGPDDPAHPPRIAIGTWDGRLVCYEHAWVLDKEPQINMMPLDN